VTPAAHVVGRRGRVARPLARLVLHTLLLAACLGSSGRAGASEPRGLPPSFGLPLGATSGAEREAMVRLGRHLFYEPALSGTGCYSCASCHQQARAFTDGRRQAVGATGERHQRNTPTLTNVAYDASFGWADPTLTRLEDQHRVPMFNTRPVELGLVPPDAAAALARLRADARYPPLFRAAFPGEQDPIAFAHLVTALAAFTRTMVSADSAFDRYVYAGDQTALSAAARRGLDLFFSRRLGCIDCHNSWNLSGPVRSTTDPDRAPTFHNTGLPDGGDQGLAAITGRAADRRRFRAPTLRNVAVTAPYMHDGSLATLEDVLRHYESGGSFDPAKSSAIRGIRLTDGERADVIAFLESLTDERFLTDARLSDPVPSRPARAGCTPAP